MADKILVGYTDDNKPLEIPSNEYIVKAVQILAKKRSGKSYAAGLIAEQLLGKGYPIVIVDPIGAHWGLKQKFEIIVIGDAALSFTDIHIPDEKKSLDGLASKIGTFISNSKRSFLFDLSHMSEPHQQIFSAELFKTLYKLNKQRRHLFIEETDVFAPQICQWDEVLHSRHQLDNLVRRGGQKGIGTTVITQRPALVSKNILTQSDLTIILNTQSPQDLDPISKILRSYKMKKEELEELKDRITELPVGHALFYSPAWLHINKFVKIAKRETYHAGATLGDPEWREMSPPLIAPRIDSIAQLKAMLKSPHMVSTDDKSVIADLTQGNIALQKENDRLLNLLSNSREALQQKHEQLIELGRRCVKAEDEVRAFSTFKQILATMIHNEAPKAEKLVSVESNGPVKVILSTEAPVIAKFNEKDSIEGKLFYLINDHFFDNWKSFDEIYQKICGTWEIAKSEMPGGSNANRFKKKLSDAIDKLVKRPYSFLRMWENKYIAQDVDRIIIKEEKK